MSFLSLPARIARQRIVFSIVRSRKRSLHNSACLYNKTDDTDDIPVKFSTSKAAGLRLDSNDNKQFSSKRTAPAYQFPIIWLSLVTMMIYCIFREENDLDEMLSFNVIEKDNIKNLIMLKKKNNLPVKDLEDRLAELEAAEK